MVLYESITHQGNSDYILIPKKEMKRVKRNVVYRIDLHIREAE